MIKLLCLMVIFGLGHCHNEKSLLPSRLEIETSINRTIDEVERMIRENPKLPRLTRPEIVEILRNITSVDLSTHSDEDLSSKARDEYQRALMVVLPYSPQESNENLNDLYTKPPVVQMLNDGVTTEKAEIILKNKGIESVVYLKELKKTDSVKGTEQSSNNFVATQLSDSSYTDSSESQKSKTVYKNHRDTYSDVTTKSQPKRTFQSFMKNERKRDPAPEKFSFNLDVFEESSGTSVTPTSHSMFKDITEQAQDNAVSGSKLEIVYSTSVTRKPMMKSTTEILQNSKFTEATTIPSKTTQHILSSDQWQYNAPPVTTEKNTRVTLTVPDKSIFAPGSMNNRAEGDVATTRKPDVRIKILGSSTDVKSGGGPVRIVKTEKPAPVYVTPMSTATSTKPKYSSTYTLASGGFLTATTPMPMSDEVKNLLASIGLRPDSNDVVENVSLKANSQIPNSDNVIYNQATRLSATGTDLLPSIVSQNTFAPIQPDFQKGVENLTPDVQLLFQKFGLQTSLKQMETTTAKPTKPPVKDDSYAKFKPLPTSTIEDKDMRDFLAKFGLDSIENRNKKAMNNKSAQDEQPSVIEAIPDSMKKILQNIGLIGRSQKSVEVVAKTNIVHEKAPTSTPKLHVFKPQEASVHAEEQRDKINKLLDTVKQVQDGKANVQDVQKVANDLLESTKSLQNGPDPLSLEEILKLYNEDIRNEVKRQESTQEQPSLADEAATESTSTTTTTVTSLMVDPAFTTTTAPVDLTNLAALADSFGGTTAAPDPVLPTRRRSGLYFLVDWNTFLEVGEEGKDKVNLRFQPKVGDRTRFIPVTVP
ncbi:uncharacterized protein LOC107272715 isoform X1 [Cephus cinctus]|uniref:Uncharacterized protein LOC107272715 isoform X1 n=1 Tax=Cephus cinctus TaxID=211228 RepID=A0AAJ7CA43_CEPCN|nr:uncharacterized protein LOC107272715 isoform X1 [Cephus cinctus]